MSDSALLLKYGAFLATFDRKKEFCCITSHVHISSCESLMGREREKEVRIILKLILPLADTEWRAKGACHPCCPSEVFMHMFLFGLPHSPLERSEYE